MGFGTMAMAIRGGNRGVVLDLPSDHVLILELCLDLCSFVIDCLLVLRDVRGARRAEDEIIRGKKS